MDVHIHEGKKRRRQGYKRWTKEANSMLLVMYDAGCSIPEMVEALGRSAPNVRARLSKMGLKLSDRGVEPNREAFEQIMERKALGL